MRDLAARINHLEEANADLDERAKGLTKDMNARSQQENLEVISSCKHVVLTFPRLPRKRNTSRVCWMTMKSRWKITKH